MKNIIAKINKKVLIISLIVIAIIVSYMISKGNSSSAFEVVNVESGRLLEKVAVTGKVKPYNRAELSFEKPGIVKSVSYKVGDEVKTGDVIVSVDTADINAQIKGAEASLMAEQARLSELRKGLRPEEISVEDSKLKSAQISYEDSRIGIINAYHDAYTKTNSALLNYADTLFINPQNAIPQLRIRSSQDESITKNRVLLGESLRKWKSDLDTMTLSSDPLIYREKIYKYAELAKVFFGQLSTAVSDANVSSSGISQTEIETYKLNVTTALSNFNSAVDAMASAEAEYRNTSSSLALANDQFNLRKAGSSDESLLIQESKVAQAEASVANLYAELSKKRLISPIDGIVGKVDSEIGEYVNSGIVEAVVVSDKFKIEVNVPESDISKIAMNNKAEITLDAYDSDIIFTAHVVSIDLAETMIEGVPTYKVVLLFDEKDARVRSGMTANISILTQDKESVVLIPFRAIKDIKGEKYVQVINDNASVPVEVRIVTGSRGSDGRVEVISGLNVGSKIAIFAK